MKAVLLPLIAALTTASAVALGGSTLEVAAGETYTIGMDQQRMVLSKLLLADGARVTFADGVDQWHVSAEYADIGSNVVIDGSGANGVGGVDGSIGAEADGRCADGVPGGNGGAGGGGVDGVDIRLQLALAGLGDLRLVSHGGVGGVGGAGGSGSNATAFDKSCSSAPVGGSAGAGGNGGNGGAAGDITVVYTVANSHVNAERVLKLVQIESEAGVAGEGGAAGRVGEGSEGRYVNKRTLTGNRQWKGGGAEGATAEAGAAGTPGTRSRTLLEPMLALAIPAQLPAAVQSQPQVKSAATEATQEQEIDAVKQELRALMQRLEQLESN